MSTSVSKCIAVCCPRTASCFCPQTTCWPVSCPVALGDSKGRTLTPHDMLWHLCRHLVGLWHPLRLVWVADIVGWVEKYADQLDWPFIRNQTPLHTQHAIAAPLGDPALIASDRGRRPGRRALTDACRRGLCRLAASDSDPVGRMARAMAVYPADPIPSRLVAGVELWDGWQEEGGADGARSPRRVAGDERCPASTRLHPSETAPALGHLGPDTRV